MGSTRSASNGHDLMREGVRETQSRPHVPGSTVTTLNLRDLISLALSKSNGHWIGPPVSQHERQPALTYRPYMAATPVGRYRAETQASMAHPSALLIRNLGHARRGNGPTSVGSGSGPRHGNRSTRACITSLFFIFVSYLNFRFEFDFKFCLWAPLTNWAHN
jgi:hypothetical protein